MGKLKLDLVIENNASSLNGRVKYNNNVIVEFAESLSELEEKVKTAQKDFEDLDPDNIEFEHYYDVYSLFEQFDFLRLSKFAEHAGIDAELLHQYARQEKQPNAEHAKKIENTLHELARQMMKANISI